VTRVAGKDDDLVPRLVNRAAMLSRSHTSINRRDTAISANGDAFPKFHVCIEARWKPAIVLSNNLFLSMGSSLGVKASSTRDNLIIS